MKPDSAAGRARWAVSLLFFVDGAALGGWAPHIATMKQSLHLSAGVLGSALLASSVGAILTMPFASLAIHRFGSRVTAAVGGLLLCAILPALVLAPSAPALAGLLFLVGVFNGQLDVGMNSHSMAVQDRFERPIVSAIHGWFSIGGFAGGAGAALAAKLGVSPLIHLAAASVCLAMLTLIALKALLPSNVDSGHEGPKFALPRGGLILLGILTFIAFSSEGGVWDWATVYLRTVLHSSPALGALGFGLFSCGMAAGRFLGDGVIHRIGPVRVLQLSAATAGVALWISLCFSLPWAAICAFALYGAAISNLVPILFRAAATVPGIPAATGLSAITTCGYTGFLIGPPLIGFVTDVKSLGFALGGLALLCILVAVTGAFVYRITHPSAAT